MKYFILLSVLYLTANAISFEEHFQPEANRTNWVLLAAGSDGWYNYRHQSDVYHAYQLIKSRGIPDSHIVVMHVDDIAHNKQNPTPGVIINKPNGTDVYHGVPKDYTGAEVTPLNFLAILRGDKVLERNHKKVIKSGPEDHIFIYFVDHGAPNNFCFPKANLYGEDLVDTFKEMHAKKQFAKLVLYTEACYSGSMFENILPKDINVYTAVSSGPKESSYLCWNDRQRGYLSDPYTAAWMHNSETKDLNKETLQEQFDYIWKIVNASQASHPSEPQQSRQYGDLSIAKLTVSQFLGETKQVNYEQGYPIKDNCDAIERNDAPIHMMRQFIKNANTFAEKQEYENQLATQLRGRQLIDIHMERIAETIANSVGMSGADLLNTRQVLYNRPCYRKFTETFHEKCINYNENTYVLPKLNVFVNTCEKLSETTASEAKLNFAVNQMVEYCSAHVVPQHISGVL